MKVDINFIKRVLLSLIWVSRNYLKFKYVLSSKFGITGTKILSLFDWHGGACYFTGIYKESKVFIKSLSSKFGILQNEHTAIQILSYNSTTNYVPQLYFHGQVGGDDFIVVEYISGSTLEYHLKNSLIEFNAHEKAEIANQLIRILEELHSRKVVHRDMRPDNIFLTRNNGLRLILIDFSFAMDSSTWNDKPRFRDIKKCEHSNEIWEALGEDYKPGKLVWDDAYSIYKLLNENKHLFALDERLLQQVKNKIGLEISTIENA